VPISALALALGSAFVHAGWNLLLARARDPQAATALAMPIGCIAFAPVAALTWDVRAAAVPYMAASALLELGYFALLARAYARGEMSAVYPLARGSAPVLVLVVSVAALGASLSAGQVVGVLLVAAGVPAVRGLRGRGVPGQAWLAFGVGVCIAGYTLIDKEGLHHAAPLPYLDLVLVLPSITYLALVGRSRGGARMRAQLDARVALAGLGMLGAYGLALAALRLAAAAPVAAVRETSVVIGTALAAVVLHERVGRLRVAGAVAIAAGVAAIALG
jgi:uncharacterized membrane protein